MAAVTSTAYGGDAAHVATRTGFGLLFTAFPLLMNELGSRTPNYTGEELRSYPSARQYFRHQWPLDDTVRQQLLVQHNQSSPLPICDAPGTPLLPRQPSTR